MINKHDKQYLRKAQERRFELQVMQEASKIKKEQNLVNRLEEQRQLKNGIIAKEGKIAQKKEKEARKLEVLEAEVLRRLRDTHIKQQIAIEEIQEIFKHKGELSQFLQESGPMLPSSGNASITPQS